MTLTIRLTTTLLFITLIFGCTNNINISNAWSRALPATAKNTAVFLTVNNNTKDAITLTGGHTDVAETLELHQHTHNNGVMQMRQLQTIDIAAGEKQQFSPGDYHIMLLGLKQPLLDGDNFELTLTTQRGINIKASVAVTKNP